ncbi:MAG: hypothetical protein A2499_18520 [Stygiobacter sp. RIFOXYC12_FULL_38_8]|nr:MAG: hypothetical protein A2X62_03095 [Stygiobacter sp. GWC2_38_9]OGU83495.1 MAG: hypothetical protein A2279_11365 [Stygiobacter sp. RIFOXYA12_FULL_38_9]OGV05958.1 MAG: hypothetical protein A2299_13440 [Stygiobacter sp. RIFOXYB2_FULL_37_11]OGV09966.1 MAG: hypothetical protein A2237_06200 [Stygiobacter sp. RIFOXYA2_FULL_38_8]OGV12909.1 MAG: hypothetical protein A2440_16900 [Stygiobacter sp. RIFOXYC2_FULL_38_25]OGV24620.1 MAG: hypothetical protein A2499_18520 [Stygiobacter sp. RIFOXYC12_FULL_
MKNEKKHSNKVFAKYSPKKIHPLLRILKMKPLRIGFSLLVGMLLLITSLEVFIPHSHNFHKKRLLDIKLSDSIETDVQSISSKFVCNCGKCSRENLTKCKCQDAIAERNMIRSLLVKNIKQGVIIKEINKKYGGLIVSQK